MVTKAELDRAMAEMNSRLEASQVDTHCRLDLAVEAIRIQMTQDRQMFLEQLQGHRAQIDQSLQQQFTEFRVELDHQHKPRSSSPPEEVRSDFILTRERRPPDMGSGSRQQVEVSLGQRTDRYQPLRADCPAFSGDNVVGMGTQMQFLL
jgi:hypothetical protein